MKLQHLAEFAAPDFEFQALHLFQGENLAVKEKEQCPAGQRGIV